MNIYDTPLDKLPIRQLKNGYYELYDMINKTCCYGTRDMILFDRVEAELYKRGYAVEENCKLYKK